jgi:G3E family GTPase
VTTTTVLVTGARASTREAAIAATINPAIATGTDPFSLFTDTGKFHIARIAPGCPCCTGNLTMRVTLNRMLRHRPATLYIGLATDAHLAQIQEFLSQPPYDALLTLTEVLKCNDAVPQSRQGS